MLTRLINWLDDRLVFRGQTLATLPWSVQSSLRKEDGGSKGNGLNADSARVWLSDLEFTARSLGRLTPKRALQLFLDIRFLRHSNFDAQFYLSQKPSDEAVEIDPVRHFASLGGQGTFDPEPYFSLNFYLKTHSDVRDAAINPYIHFLHRGHLEGRRFEPSSFGSGRHENDLRVEDWRTVAWPLKTAATSTHRADLYAARPDDAVIPEAQSGARFFEKYALLTSKPNFAKAVEELNRLPAVAPSENPAVSIVIPVYGQLAYTLNCLHALLGHSSRHSFEILVGDDASPDNTALWVGRIENVRLIRHGANGGFIQNCNLTAGHARGDHIVFLNNDTRVVEGWLDALIESFDTLPGAGLVGSKIFYPDGTLQEAGGIVWRDGSAWNYGRNDDPNRPRYCHARQVDYVSGCAIAIRTDAWKRLEGFDTHYAPAYYEDTDLAFRIREIGLKVWMQPLSRIIHYEGRTSGTDLNQGAKAYQVENHAKFYRRWKDRLLSHRENGVDPWLERQRDVRKFVLVLDTVTPRPTHDAGSVVTVALLKAYQALGYHVLFLPEDNFLFDPVETPRLQSLGIECMYAPYETSLGEIITRFSPYLTVLQLIRPEPATRALDVLEGGTSDFKRLYLNADLHYLRIERQAQVEKRLDLLLAADDMKKTEFAIFNSVDAILVHSTFEKELLLAENSALPVAVLPLAFEAPSIDVSPAGRQDIIFVAGFGHPPNVDAALWLIDEIWPSVASLCPEARLLIVGANPPSQITSKASSRIVVTGHVPDLTPWFAKARVFVAPLRFGAGAKGKLVAAMTNGIPIVSTSVGIEGMTFDIEQVGAKADTAEEIGERIVTLYTASDESWKTLSANGQGIAAREFSQGAMTSALKAIVAGPDSTA